MGECSSEDGRRLHLMRMIIDGMPHVDTIEHKLMYRDIRRLQPDTEYTANSSGVFYPMRELTTATLEHCAQIVRHAIQQAKNEHARTMRRRQIRLGMQDHAAAPT